MLMPRDHWSCSSLPSQFADPGDRFIPTRSLMDLDLAHCALMRRREKKRPNSVARSWDQEEYRRRVEENLTMDAEGRPFRMLVFRRSPMKCKRRMLLVDEMLQDEQDTKRAVRAPRRLPTSPDKVLDAPKLLDDYYLKLMDWGKNNVLAIALGTSLYLLNAGTGDTDEIMRTNDDDVYPTSVAWSEDSKLLAVGFSDARIELVDVESSRHLRSLGGHVDRVGSLSWNSHLLTSGSRDCSIINQDVRISARPVSRFQAHMEEVCGLRWSPSGNFLASGGNDNIVHIWESPNRDSTKYLHRFIEHSSAVKALAWCPFQENTLASGGGTADHCIKIWNTQTGKCTNSIDAEAQVCALEWSSHHKELLSGHGYSQNQLCLWKYPSMTKFGELKGHTARVLHVSQSPDGSTVVSAAADETLRFWKVFEPETSTTRSKRVRNKRNNIFSMSRTYIR